MSDIDTSAQKVASTKTHPAGEDVTDEAFVRTVERQTSSDHTARALFERERDGAVSDTEAAKTLDWERGE